MKKLERLKLKEFHKSMLVLDRNQANKLKGGDLPGINNPYQLSEVVVHAYGNLCGVMGWAFNYTTFISNYSPSLTEYNDPNGGGTLYGSEPYVYGSTSDPNYTTYDPNSDGGGSSFEPSPTMVSFNGLRYIASWEQGPSGGAALIPYDDNGTAPGG